MTPTLETFAIIQLQTRTGKIAKSVRLIGIDIKSRTAVGGFRECLVNPENRADPSFELRGDALQRHEENGQRAQQQMKPLSLPLEPTEIPPVQAHEPPGIIVGYAVLSYREHDENDQTKVLDKCRSAARR